MAMNFGADSKLSQCVDCFIKEVEDDFVAPHQSSFQNYMQKVKRDVQEMEEGLSNDKSYVRKLSASLKTVQTTGESHSTALTAFADELVKFGTMTSASDPDIGNAFVKFGTLFNQMSSLLKNLISSSRSVVYYSLNLLFENELKGGKYKSNINSLFNQYETARNTTEKEEKKMMQQQGQNIQDRVFSAEELADKLVPERRKFQLGASEYMLKVLDVRMKRGVDLADHLVGYYQGAQESYFSDGSKLLSAMRQWEARLSTQLSEIRTKQDKEKKRLAAVKERIKEDLGLGVKSQGFTQVDPSNSTELTQKSGYLAKRPEKLENLFSLPRRAWPKRYCTVSSNGFTMAHSHTHAPHVRIPVMLFQFKEAGEIDGKKFCFRLQAQSRTYTFDAESDMELNAWRQVMTNCQLKLFEGGDNTIATPRNRNENVVSPTTTGDTRQLVKQIIQVIQRLPGNDRCCDCGGHDPEWLSVNLGVLMCIHCSGRHRELGVQYSRIRSLKLDALKTSELLIARVMGNELLNEVMEAQITPEEKISHDVDIDKRRQFITSKYIDKKFVTHQLEQSNLLNELLDAVEMRDIRYLLQVYAEGANLKAPLLEDGRTCIHIAIEQEDLTSLHIIDFILANSRIENMKDSLGNTPMHMAALTDNPQCIKLLLNHNADLTIRNNEQKTALDIAEEKKFDDCIELLHGNKQAKCEHIDIDWGVNGGEQDDDIYQSPVDMGGMKRSETADNILDGGRQGVNGLGVASHLGVTPSYSPRVTRHTNSSSSPYMEPRRRPISQFITNEVKSASDILGGSGNGQKSPRKNMDASTSVSQINPFPPPSNPAPPPPTRTVSKTVDPITGTSVPVVPKRKKRESTIPIKYQSSDAHRRTVTPPTPTSPLLIVEALYQCDPDREDELGFKEGDRIIVTAKLNEDWWRGYVDYNKTKVGVFPVNYVRPIQNGPNT